jgi:poly(U)-binding-splicing factor PUF60
VVKTAAVTQTSSQSLPPLDFRQTQALHLAKRYCQDVTIKAAQTKRQAEQQAQMLALQEAANRQRALLLMSRIYIGSIYFELGEDVVRNAFYHFGTIKAINMSWEGTTGRHKGYAFVEYETAESAQIALDQMNGVMMGGRNIKVGRPNNVPQAAAIIHQIHEEASKYNRIFVASIHTDLTEEEVKSVFEPFGVIKSIQLAPDTKPGKHRGWGYIEYDSLQAAADAIAAMNLFELGGQYLRVGRAVTPPMPLYPPGVTPVVPGVPLITSPATQGADQITSQLSTRSTSGFDDAAPKDTQSSLKEIQAKLQAASEKSGGQESRLDQEENVSISGSSARLMIMKKLSRKSETCVVVLRNMVSIEEVDEDLQEEVGQECGKFGKVVNVVIHQDTTASEEESVKIFVVFSAASEADKAISSLNGRWFGGRVVTAEGYEEEKFEVGDYSD